MPITRSIVSRAVRLFRCAAPLTCLLCSCVATSDVPRESATSPESELSAANPDVDFQRIDVGRATTLRAPVPPDAAATDDCTCTWTFEPPDAVDATTVDECTVEFTGLTTTTLRITAEVDCPDAAPASFSTAADIICLDDAACTDGLFCNGVERCTDAACVDDTPPCEEPLCDEDNDRCTLPDESPDLFFVCGNGFLEGDESCDDGNDLAGDGCDPDCAVETVNVCGNGSLDTGEQCDDGSETEDCNADCTVASCGDGRFNAAAGEECDDGNTQPGDGCTTDCLIEPGRTYYVDRPGDGIGLDGSDDADGSESAPFATIQTAADLVLPGDTVIIRAGTYVERVIIQRSGIENHPITFRGEDVATTIINGENEKRYGIDIDAGSGQSVGYVNFSDFTVLRANQNGLNVLNGHHMHFDRIISKENRIYGSFWGGFSGGGTHDVTVRHCFFFRNGTVGDFGSGMRIGDRSRHFVFDMLVEDTVSHSNAAFIGATAETATGFNINSPQNRLPDRPTHNITLRRCAAYNNGSSGISSQLPTDLLWSDCISFDNNVVGSPGGEGVGFRFGFSGANCRAVRCISFNNRAEGFAFEFIDNASLFHCISYRNGFLTPNPGSYGMRSAIELIAANNISSDNARGDASFVVAQSDYNFIADGQFPKGEGRHSITTTASNALFADPPSSGADLGVRTWIDGVEIEGNDLTTWQEIYDQLQRRFAPAPNGAFIDAGIELPGITGPFNGAAPDIGAFESDG